MRVIKRIAVAALATTAGAAATAALAVAPASAHESGSFIGRFHSTGTVASTVPANGDVNPYGVAVVRHSEGMLVSGDVLVSNFNNAKNIQGTGTTIVQVAPNGTMTQFAHISSAHLPGSCPGGVGLTTALTIVSGGWVIVGSLPTAHSGTEFTGSGCLLVLNSQGQVVETLAGHGINGPWDMAAASFGPFDELFVSNVLNGTVQAGGQVVHRGTVLRLVLANFGDGPPQLLSVTRIGSGFGEETNSSALVIGPTGLALGQNGTLYVADTVASRIAAIPDATFRPDSMGDGLTVSEGGALSGPLGLTMAPNGDVLAVNSGNGKIIEVTPEGSQIATHQLDSAGSPPGAGALFGLAVAPHGTGVYYVDDNTNSLDVLN
jgi:hypothetical protein